MALARWTATAQDAEGNAVAGCSIEVRSEDTGRLVQVYADRAGTVALGNPFVAPEATFGFHVEGGAYKITATKGAFQSIWRYVAIGTASEFDYDQFIYELQAGLMPVATFAEIDGQAPGVDQSLAAIVLADPDPMRNGYYLWDQGAGQWQRKRPLPDTLARLTVVGGTANALEALASPGVDPGAVLAFFIDVPTANTGPVTLSINDAPELPVRDVNGDGFAPGVFTGRLFLSNEGDHLRALIGGDILAAAAQALAQANRAEQQAERSSTEADRAETAAGNAEFTSFGLGEISQRVSDLDVLRGTRMFGIPGGAVGSPSTGADGVGWQIEETGQRSQIAIMTSTGIYMRTDDAQPQPGAFGPWRQIGTDGTPWAVQPIGVPIPVFTNLSGVSAPPNGGDFYRYIKLTASDSYNSGLLSNESVSGSAPLVQATARIADAASPLNGQTVRLINTERRFLRAGAVGSVENDQLQKMTGEAGINAGNGHGLVASGSGVFVPMDGPRNQTNSLAGQAARYTQLGFDSSKVARSGDDTRPKNIGVDYYMRIR